MRVDLVLQTPISRSSRARQLEAVFDVPATERSKVEFHGNIDLESEPWQVGLIVGPSGSGKTRISEHLFGVQKPLEWTGASVIDDFPKDLPIQTVTDTCKAVGFNTIPAWLRPHAVLSNGERFRVELARHLLSADDPIVVDEFTSVVDRQVAQIGAHAVQKYVRRTGKKFVAVSCHYDVIDWLQPDWIFEPATWTLQRRRLQRRPDLQVTVGPVPLAAWRVFSQFHYLTANLNPIANCFGLWVGDQLAAFAAFMRRPHPVTKNIVGCSRVVVLPDWQGLGLMWHLLEPMAQIYKAVGEIVHVYPTNPTIVRQHKPPKWEMRKKPGVYSNRNVTSGDRDMLGAWGGRPCAVFRWTGPAWPDKAQAERILSGEKLLRREWARLYPRTA